MQETTLTLSVDPEHAGLRFTVVLVFVVTAVIVYTLASIFLPSASGFSLISAALALAGAAVVTQMTDRLFKQRWQSGRTVTITGDKIALVNKGKTQIEIDGAQHVNVLLWRFEITKRTRIPKGHFMTALALQQEDTYLAVYTFVSPDNLEKLPYGKQYVKLIPKKQQNDQDMRLAGQQRRLHIAEDVRWNAGAEMSQADFETYVNHLRQQFPQWMPTE